MTPWETACLKRHERDEENDARALIRLPSRMVRGNWRAQQAEPAILYEIAHEAHQEVLCNAERMTLGLLALRCR